MLQTLGQAPIDTPLNVTNGQVDISDDIHWANFYAVLFNILLNVGPTLRKVADVTFPPCPAQSSVDVDVPFPGVKPATLTGDIAPVVTLGLSGNAQYTVNNGFIAYVRDVDVVTIREFCVDAFGIGGFTDTFTIMVSTGEPGVK